MGLMWHKFPLITGSFEVSLTVQVKAPEKETARDAQFAFWYVYDNVTATQESVTANHMHNQDELIRNTWNAALNADGYQLVGYKSKYDGLGVFFADTPKSEGGFDPLIVGVGNDGVKDVPLAFGQMPDNVMRHNYRTNTEVKVKITVQPDSAKVEIEGGATQEIKQPFKSGGYIGLTAFGGMKGSHALDEKSYFVEVKKLSVVNKDANSKGEDVPKAAAAVPVKAEDKVDMLHEQSSFRDHRAESEAIKELTNTVFKLVVETQPMRTQMNQAVEALTKRLGVLEKTFALIKGEINKKSGHDLSKEFEDIKKELTTLSTVASTESKEKHAKLEELHKNIADVHQAVQTPEHGEALTKLTEATQRTIDNVTTEHQRMFGISIAAIAFIIIAGLSLYNKFRCWEKKHIL